ncbi:transcription factor HES-3-like [Dendropsophus ebraccatus]|uniref:transcription factor HES-3-like n=1 Tax=Dendropsophus ebraccatus TaxID=150705 RepID=UPI0038314E98
MMSKPLMEKKRRARINNSLEELKTLLEKHYSYNVRKRKLEKADILELTVKHIENLLSMRQRGMVPVDLVGISDYREGFQGCLTKLSAYITRKTSQETPGPVPVHPPSAPQTQDHVPPSPEILQQSYPQIDNKTRSPESGNSQWKPSAGNISVQRVLSQQRTDTTPSSSSSLNNRTPSHPQTRSAACWRPW